jgi:malate synthase
MQQVVHIAHKRGIHAIGGASNYVPRVNQPKATQTARQFFVEEKLREAKLGFDGSWAVHPLLVDTGRKCF